VLFRSFFYLFIIAALFLRVLHTEQRDSVTCTFGHDDR